MKKKYQIAKQRAVQDFRQMAERDNPAVEMVLPMVEIASYLQQGVGHLMRQAGLELMKLVMAEEVKQLVGDRYAQDGNRRAHRWGQEDGYCVVDGQKVPIQRQRVRDKENKEVRLGSYELFQRQGPMQAAVRDRMMRGLSTRNYGAVTKQL